MAQTYGQARTVNIPEMQRAFEEMEMTAAFVSDPRASKSTSIRTVPPIFASCSKAGISGGHGVNIAAEVCHENGP